MKITFFLKKPQGKANPSSSMFEASNLTSEAYAAFLSEFDYKQEDAFLSLLKPVVVGFFEKAGKEALHPAAFEAFSRSIWNICNSEAFPHSGREEGGAGEGKEDGEGKSKEFSEADLAEYIIRILEEVNLFDLRFEVAFLSKNILNALRGQSEEVADTSNPDFFSPADLLQLRYFLSLHKGNRDLFSEDLGVGDDFGNLGDRKPADESA